jgi:two-component system, sensor histidine kinase and response regulator
VKDYGVGISPELHDKLFNLGERVSGVGTEGEEGTGLGLALCSEFIIRNGGSIWFESALGKGSCFWFSLPVVHTK